MTQKQKRHAEQIFTEAYNQFEKPLRGYAFSKVHDKVLAEDITQETFMKTWAFLTKGGEIMSMRSFLYHVMSNLIVDEYRKHKTTSLDALLEEKDFEPSIDESEKLIDTLDGRVLLPLIQKLPKSYRVVMHMRYIKELSIQEIAKLVMMSDNNVSVQIHRAHTMLKKLCEQRERKPMFYSHSFPIFFERRMVARV